MLLLLFSTPQQKKLLNFIRVQIQEINKKHKEELQQQLTTFHEVTMLFNS